MLVPGGDALIYAWAFEQDAGGLSGHRFATQDVLVPYHFREHQAGGSRGDVRAGGDSQLWRAGDRGPGEGERDAGEPGVHRRWDPVKRAWVYQRFCHVYRRGELEELAWQVPGARVVSSGFDAGNWTMVLRKNDASQSAGGELWQPGDRGPGEMHRFVVFPKVVRAKTNKS